jgi:hypothetical protein
VKLSLSDLHRLFSDPLFNNKVNLKPTASGFIVEANIQEQTICLSTHWPHDGMLDPQFLHELAKKIVKKFIE